MIQLMFVSVLIAFGLYFLLAEMLHLPTWQASRAMLVAGRDGKSAGRTLDTWLMAGAARLSRHLRIDTYKRKRMENILKAVGYTMTPEFYTAYALTKSAAILLCVIPSLLLFPLLSPLIILLAVLSYFKATKKAEEQLKDKRDRIEGELPRFVATVEQTLKSSSRDILAMLEAYKKNAGSVFVKELDVLTADMRSSDYEAALTRFDARITSAMLSDVIRGLIGVLRGDDSTVYFQMLSHDFKALELQRLKSKAQKVPPKIRVFSFIMLLCFLFTYLAVIALEIINSLGAMF